MIKYILKRMLTIVPVGLGVTLLLFLLLNLTPGDPALVILGIEAPPEALEQFRREHYLDRSLLERYGIFVYNVVVHQDMGRSYQTRRPVIDEVANTFPVSMELAAGGIIIATVLGLVFGIVCAVKQYSIFDNVAMIFAMLGISIPIFFLALLLILLFSVHLRWLPSSGFDSLSQRILPWIALSSMSMSIITRMTRSSMLEVIRSDYVRTARAKGQVERVIILKHALRNALIPIITIIGIQFGHMIGNAIITESVFSIAGMGRLVVEAIRARDYPIVQGGVFVIAMAYVIINLLVDLLYAWVDPKLRTRYGG